MRNQEPGAQRFPYMAIVVIIVLTVMIVGFIIAREMVNKRRIDREVASLRAEIEQLESKHAGLISLIDYYKSSQYIEETARTTMNYKKPGEQVVVVALPVHDQRAVPTDQQEAIGTTDRLTNVRNWWDYFFGPTRSLN